ncbi:hypothetical protein EHQ43_11680 [Leptospira bouyouniensis]|uniref:Uracil-DNA glycosylase n=1 Tax=Leptospira bouyouniensis TaxID=2484911 RepID=A0A7I0HPR3_9LEPT|nr:hypothetical protein [Leptospira bouyouniensis]TGL04058.1 hypothetical protein EHQ43_11680 [Leptospira bouyouniensis]
MSKTEKLNALFEKWKNSHPEFKNSFVSDGIINEEEYLKAKVKILVLTKESNNPEQSEEDYRDWWKYGIKFGFSRRIAEWSYGILNNFPPVQSISEENLIDSIRKIAFMNVKKIAGGSTANDAELEHYLNRDKEFILEQIAIIEPDVIITGIAKDEYLNLLYPNLKLKSSGYDILIGKEKNMKFVSFYHPSYRVPRAMAYALLKEVCLSEEFKSLD